MGGTHYPLWDFKKILDLSNFQANFSDLWLEYLLWNVLGMSMDLTHD